MATSYSVTGIYTGPSGELIVLTKTAQPIDFYTGDTLRARFDPTGLFKVAGGGTVFLNAAGHEIRGLTPNAPVLLVSNAEAVSPFGLDILFSAGAPNDATRWLLRMSDNVAARALFNSNGGLANYSANNVNLSDADVKGAIEPYDDKDLDGLEVAFAKVNWGKFKYLDQTHTDWNHGYTAQGIEDAFAGVAPELVDETQIGVRKGDPPRRCVYDTDLTHIAMALLARALKRIAVLEGKLAAAG